MKRFFFLIIGAFWLCASMVQNTQASVSTVTNMNVGGAGPSEAQQINCTLSLDPFAIHFSPNGGTHSFSINTSNAACSWTAKSNNAWITITAGNTGTGNGTVTYNVNATKGPSRNGTITITLSDGSNEIFLISQNTGCTYSLNPTTAEFPTGGGSGSFNVITSDAGCNWYALKNENWVTINSETGIGNGTVTFTVQPNTGTKRTENISVWGLGFTIIQDGTCTFSLEPIVANASSAGGTFSFRVMTQQYCVWRASTNDSWINITTGSGNGNGQVNFTVQANSGEARTGTITMGSQTFTINQDSRCSYSLSRGSTIAAVGGGNGNFSVMAPEGCLWTAISNVPWIIIESSGMSGRGNGTIYFKVQANSVSARQGTITINGVVYTVYQHTVPQSQPTTISGVLRIRDTLGKPIRNALVTFRNTLTGEERTIISNPFGYANLKDIQAGQEYVITATHKQYRFNQLTVAPLFNPFGFEFRALL